MGGYETLRLERTAPGVVLITLDRPDRFNALNPQVFAELLAVVEEIRADREARAVVLTGAGRAFCAGMDLDVADVFTQLSRAELLELADNGARSFHALYSLPQPVIAAVNGVAAGGGFCLAMNADLRLVSPQARFTSLFVKIGLSSGDLGLSWLLPRAIGSSLAAELLFTGREVDAEEAVRIGLANRVVPADSLLETAVSLAGDIAALPPTGVQLSKRSLHASQETSSYPAALESEIRGQVIAMGDPATEVAVAAVRERQASRQPVR